MRDALKAMAFIALLVVGISVLVTIGAALTAIGGVIGIFICIFIGIYAIYSLTVATFKTRRR